MPTHPNPDRSTDTALGSRNASSAADRVLLSKVVAAVQATGKYMRERFSYDSRVSSGTEIVAAIRANDAASLDVLREPLMKACPSVGWSEDEDEGGELPPGEWWVIDAVEGNINHIHGLTDWGMTATLVRNNKLVLTVVYLPLTNSTYTAVQGGGAYHDGVRLHPSAKTEMGSALVGTGQSKPGEDKETYRRIGLSVTAMLEHALVLRVSVPATLQLVQVAAGRMDAFWQYSQVRSGLLAGALLVAEAGGTITDTHGEPWSLASDDFLATAPGLHNAAVDVLSTIA